MISSRSSTPSSRGERMDWISAMASKVIIEKL
jgi:hypothetical protein